MHLFMIIIDDLHSSHHTKLDHTHTYFSIKGPLVPIEVESLLRQASVVAVEEVTADHDSCAALQRKTRVSQ